MEKELRALIWITVFMVTLAVGLNLRKHYAEWVCSALCEQRGQYGTVRIDTLSSNCLCAGKLEQAK